MMAEIWKLLVEYFDALTKTEILLRALIAGLLASISSGIVGSFIVARRITYMAAGIAHCTFGGMALAQYLRSERGVEWVRPLHGAIFAAVLSALIIGWVSLRWRQREDTVISALWSLSMALGVLLIQWTHEYAADPMSYLFGSLLMVSQENILLISVLDLVVIVATVLFYNRFLAVCFDDEFARLRGVSADFYFLLLLAITALTVVVLVYVVGLIMVIALLTIPVAIANQFLRRMWQVMVVAILISMVLATSGQTVGYCLNMPSSPTIIILAAGLYLFVVVIARLVRAGVRRSRPAAPLSTSP